MEDPHFSYNIFHGNTTRELATQTQSTLTVPEGLPKAKGFMKSETGKKPLCDVGNTLSNIRRIIKSMPEPCKSSETRNICSASDLKGLPDCSYQPDEVFCDEIDVRSCEYSKMIDLDLSLDPVPKPCEDSYEDIIPSDRDISVAVVHKMVYLWEQYDLPQCFTQLDNTLPLPVSPLPVTDDLLVHVQELPVPDPIPLAPFGCWLSGMSL